MTVTTGWGSMLNKNQRKCIPDQLSRCSPRWPKQKQEIAFQVSYTLTLSIHLALAAVNCFGSGRQKPQRWQQMSRRFLLWWMQKLREGRFLLPLFRTVAVRRISTVLQRFFCTRWRLTFSLCWRHTSSNMYWLTGTFYHPWRWSVRTFITFQSTTNEQKISTRLLNYRSNCPAK